MLPDPARSRVALIGTSRFTDPGLPDLPAVRNNLDGLAASLRGTGRCRVVADPDSPVALIDPIHDAATEAEDTLIVYYAGHGLVHPRTLGLLLAVVGSTPERTHTAVPYDQVRECLLDSPAARKVVILDCCYSGRALGGMADPTTAVANEATVEGTYLLASAPPNKQALSPPGERYTAFTGALLTLLTDGIPNGPRHLQLDLIYRQVRDALKRAARPEPQLRTNNTAGELALVRNPWHQPKFEAIPGVPIIDFAPPKRDVRERLKELLRETGLDMPYACPVCGTRVGGQNLVRHFDLHTPEETASLPPATLTLTPLPVLLEDRYRLTKDFTESRDLVRAFDTVAKTAVLVKRLPGYDLSAQAMRLRHRAIIRVLDLLTDHVVLEYVDAQPVAATLRSSGPMDADLAVSITIDICLALGYLHEHGFVHGDLNTGTVLLTRDGAAKLFGFDIKETGDTGADTYGTGCLLLELLTGMAPALHLLTSYAGAAGAVEIPAALDEVVRTAMHPDPAERYQTPAEFRHALMRVQL
jgi:hypothetical protein